MSILKTSALVVAGVLVAAYAVGQIAPWKVQTEIEIDAPPSAVWAVLSDNDNYAEWNPFITEVTGTLEEGKKLAISIQLGEGAPSKFTPIVLVAEENKELRWLGGPKPKGIFDGEHYFILEETAQGTTRFRHGEVFTGLLIYAVMPFINKATTKGFNAMNSALKETVEARS